MEACLSERHLIHGPYIGYVLGLRIGVALNRVVDSMGPVFGPMTKSS
jgi:hypothetical protein